MSKSIDGSYPITYPKWFGGSASCMAVLVSHPLDLRKSVYFTSYNKRDSDGFVVKVRMQMGSGDVKAGTLTTCIRIVRGEGVLALYNGVGRLKKPRSNMGCSYLI